MSPVPCAVEKNQQMLNRRCTLFWCTTDQAFGVPQIVSAMAWQILGMDNRSLGVNISQLVGRGLPCTFMSSTPSRTERCCRHLAKGVERACSFSKCLARGLRDRRTFTYARPPFEKHLSNRGASFDFVPPLQQRQASGIGSQPRQHTCAPSYRLLQGDRSSASRCNVAGLESEASSRYWPSHLLPVNITTRPRLP